MIELQGVSVSLHRHQILRDVTLAVGAEEVLAIVGPSGSGKSTLLRVVLGFIAPSGGKRVHQRQACQRRRGGSECHPRNAILRWCSRTSHSGRT